MKLIFTIFIITFLSACGQPDKPEEIADTVWVDSASFVQEYSNVQKQNPSEESIIDSLAIMNFYMDSVSTPHGYCLLFHYLLAQHDESYSEGVGMELYNGLKKYSVKRLITSKYTSFLPKAEGDTLQYLITSAMSLDLFENGYTEEKYKKDFTYLTSESNLKAFNFLVTKQGNE